MMALRFMYGELTDQNANQWVERELMKIDGDDRVQRMSERVQEASGVTFGQQEILKESC